VTGTGAVIDPDVRSPWDRGSLREVEIGSMKAFAQVLMMVTVTMRLRKRQQAD